MQLIVQHVKDQLKKVLCVYTIPGSDSIDHCVFPLALFTHCSVDLTSGIKLSNVVFFKEALFDVT